MQRGTLNSGKTGITGTPAREMDYTLDPVGNWNSYLTKTSGTTDLNQGRTQSTVNEISAITASGSTPVWTTPAYDAAGNMTTLPQPGALTSSFTGVYDAWNRLVQISDSGTTVAQYRYDGMNRRIVKLTYTSGTLSETRHFYYSSKNQDIEERVGSSTSMDKQFVWGVRYVDELVCRDDATPLRLYAAQDANFNVTGLISTAGAVQQRFLYDPYGNPFVYSATWSSTTDAYAWTRRFTGQFYDPETLLYFYRARYYHQMLGLFAERDSIGYGEGMNLYRYVNSNPTSYTDPEGTKQDPPCGCCKIDWYRIPFRELFGPYYGQWCGGNWSGGKIPSRNNGQMGTAPPIDSLDDCCKSHDFCYDACDKSQKHNHYSCIADCNKVLVTCVNCLNPDCTKWTIPQPAGCQCSVAAKMIWYINKYFG
jgi:RHS repeat-associated protein